MKVRLCLAQSVFSILAAAQVLPGGAHVDLYFPHFADGGAPTQQWQTTFTFVNPNTSPAEVMLKFRADDGRPLALDVGLGALAAEQRFTLLPLASRVIRSDMSSPAILTGWAMASSSVPIQGMVAFRYLVNGEPRQEITTEPTLPTLGYVSFARLALGVAIANPMANIPTNVVLAARDRNGITLGEQRLSIPALGHVSFNLIQLFSLPGNFEGSLEIRSANPPTESFLAWTLNFDREMLSALPPGAALWPMAHPERIRLVFSRLLAAAMRMKILQVAPALEISTAPEINAQVAGNSAVRISVGMSELIGDSESELAFVIGHELGHIIQAQTGAQTDDPVNREFDADIKGTKIVLASGYDPYAAAGSLAKLSLATGSASLISQIDGLFAADAKRSFDARLGAIYSHMTKACADLEIRSYCTAYKSIVHPHIPTMAPLAAQPSRQ